MPKRHTGSTSKPQSSSNHDKIIEESPAKTVNGMTAKLAKFREEPLGSFREAGWAHAGKENYNYCFILLRRWPTGKTREKRLWLLGHYWHLIIHITLGIIHWILIIIHETTPFKLTLRLWYIIFDF